MLTLALPDLTPVCVDPDCGPPAALPALTPATIFFGAAPQPHLIESLASRVIVKRGINTASNATEADEDKTAAALNVPVTAAEVSSVADMLDDTGLIAPPSDEAASDADMLDDAALIELALTAIASDVVWSDSLPLLLVALDDRDADIATDASPYLTPVATLDRVAVADMDDAAGL